MPSTKAVIGYRIIFFFNKILHNFFRSQLELFLTIYIPIFWTVSVAVNMLTCQSKAVHVRRCGRINFNSDTENTCVPFSCSFSFFGHNCTLHRGSMFLQVPFKNQQSFLLVTTSIPGKKLVYVYGGLMAARVVCTVQYQPLLIFPIFWSLSWMFSLTFLIL